MRFMNRVRWNNMTVPIRASVLVGLLSPFDEIRSDVNNKYLQSQKNIIKQ